MNYHIFCNALFFPSCNYGLGCYLICNEEEFEKLKKMDIHELKHTVNRSAELIRKQVDDEKHIKYIIINKALNELHKKITHGRVNIYICFLNRKLFRSRRNSLLNYEREYIDFFNVFNIKVMDLGFETNERELMLRLRKIFNSILKNIYLGD